MKNMMNLNLKEIEKILDENNGRVSFWFKIGENTMDLQISKIDFSLQFELEDDTMYYDIINKLDLKHRKFDYENQNIDYSVCENMISYLEEKVEMEFQNIVDKIDEIIIEKLDLY